MCALTDVARDAQLSAACGHRLFQTAMSENATDKACFR